MTNQALDHNEILSIRWAHDDPNPIAKQSIEMADKDAVLALLQAKGVNTTPTAFEYPVEYNVPHSKPLLTENGEEILAEYPELNYPDTDRQYQQTTGSSTGEAGLSAEETAQLANMTAEEVRDYYEKRYAQQAALNRLGLASSSYAPATAMVAEENNSKKRNIQDSLCTDQYTPVECSEDWQMHKDETTGAMYYFNANTGESTWTKPESFNNKKK